KRLMDGTRIKAGETALDTMLLTLAAGGFVKLDPEPPQPQADPAVPALPAEPYRAGPAAATPGPDQLLVFPSRPPPYWAYPVNQLGIADRDERLQAFESVLEVPRPLLRYMRVPRDLPPGPLAVSRLDPELIARGLIVARPPSDSGADEDEDYEEEEEE